MNTISINSRPASQTRVVIDPVSQTRVVIDKKTQLLPAVDPRIDLSCLIPFDPAARNISFGGKTKFTQTLITASAILMLAEIVVGGGFVPLDTNNMLGPSVDSIVMMGGLSQDLVQSGQIWRIPWACMLHAGIFHLIMNLIVWIGLGYMMEPDWGFWRFGFIFFASGITGNIFSATLDAVDVSVGSSGGIFGIMAGLPIYIIEYWQTIPLARCMLQCSIGATALAIATSFVPYVDIYAHLGGCLGGLLAAAITLRRIGIKKERQCLVEDFPRRSDPFEDSIQIKNGFREINYRAAVTPSYPNRRPQTRHRNTKGFSNSIIMEKESGLQHGDSSVSISHMNQSATSSLRFPRSANTFATVINRGKTGVVSRWLKNRELPTHFTFDRFEIGQDDRRNRNLTNLIHHGGSQLVMNPAASRMSLRRSTIFGPLNDDKYDWASCTAWGIRISALILLLSIWAVLLYLLFVCSDCYTPPGQIFATLGRNLSQVNETNIDGGVISRLTRSQTVLLI